MHHVVIGWTKFGDGGFEKLFVDKTRTEQGLDLFDSEVDVGPVGATDKE
jgi:hypothetical protein